MKKIILLLLPILLSSCASIPQSNQPTAENVSRAEQIIEDAIPYIRPAASTAVKLALQYAEKDIEKREELRNQIFVVSGNLNALLVRGDFSPQDVTEALKVKEEYIDSVLASVAIVYSATYDKLRENKSSGLAIDVLKALAQGVEDGTR